MYFQIYKKIYKSNIGYRPIKNSSIIEFFINRASILFVPIFIILKVAPNKVTILNFLIAIFAIYLIALDNSFFTHGILLFFLTILIDNIDGSVARYTQKTFFGKFLDSLSDAFVYSLIYLSISLFFFKTSGDLLLLAFGVFSSSLILFEVLVLDKFSALVRWSNEENKNNFSPYIRKTFLLRFFLVLRDIILTLTFLLIFIVNEIELFRLSLFIINLAWLISSISNVVMHIYFAKKYLNFKKK